MCPVNSVYYNGCWFGFLWELKEQSSQQKLLKSWREGTDYLYTIHVCIKYIYIYVDLLSVVDLEMNKKEYKLTKEWNMIPFNTWLLCQQANQMLKPTFQHFFFLGFGRQ